MPRIANGTVIQQYSCNSTQRTGVPAPATSTGRTCKISNRNNSAEVLDVTNVSTSDNLPIQLWNYSGREEPAVASGTGRQRLLPVVNRN